MNYETNYNKARPLVGVFVNKKFFRKKKVALFARKLSQANAKAHCSIFFFSKENVKWKKQRINGYVLEGHSKQWLERQLPFPDIIYDRGTGFSGEDKASVEALRSRFKKMPEIHFINSCKLKKWQVYQRLSKHKVIKKYLPVTIFSSGINDIKAMIAKYDYLFLKSSDGSGGKGVFAIERYSGGFHFHYYHKNSHLKRDVSSLDPLGAQMKKIALKPNRVIIQQGIQLVRYNNRPLDLRVLMVKDKKGIWNAVYNQARVAPKGAVITNVSLGGKANNYSDIYPALKKKYPGIPSEKKINDLCIIISRYIEREFGPFGEIGIDIGVDVNSEVWLLEANSKPSKLPEKKIEDTVGISPQFLMILEYARFLYLKKTSDTQ